jgi:hypothetical protein
MTPYGPCPERRWPAARKNAQPGARTFHRMHPRFLATNSRRKVDRQTDHHASPEHSLVIRYRAGGFSCPLEFSVCCWPIADGPPAEKDVCFRYQAAAHQLARGR